MNSLDAPRRFEKHVQEKPLEDPFLTFAYEFLRSTHPLVLNGLFFLVTRY